MTANEKYVKEIIKDYDALSERCDELNLAKENKEAQEIILSLKNTIRAHSGMVALSANQIGFYKRVICMNFNGDIRTFVNPIVTSVSGVELSREYCNSLEGCYIRPRNSKVSITYQTPLGKIQSVELVGMAARLMQHHIDHLDGILLSDIGLEVTPEFDAATDGERQEVISFYLDALDLQKATLKEDIENDEACQKLQEGIRFIESVQKGETVIEDIPLSDEELKQLMDKNSEKESEE